jgi:hypothetical protein
MKKSTQFLIFLLVCTGFIAVLYINNKPPGNANPGSLGNEEEKFIAQIDSLGSAAYNEQKYKTIKSQILGANHEAEIDDSQKSGLINSLEIAKTNSLIFSFDEIKNSNCLTPSALRNIVVELKKQQQLVPIQGGRNRIDQYNNMIRFLSIQGNLNQFFSGPFSAETKRNLINKINNASSLDGVQGCGKTSTTKNQYLNSLNDFENKSNLFVNLKLQIANRELDCKKTIERNIDKFQKYKYLFENFNCN